MRILLIAVTSLLMTAALFWLISSPALAQTQSCGPYGKYKSHLSDNFGEVPVNRGIASNGNVMVVFTSAEGSWTIMAVLPSNIACIVAVGEAWESVDPPPDGPAMSRDDEGSI